MNARHTCRSDNGVEEKAEQLDSLQCRYTCDFSAVALTDAFILQLEQRRYLEAPLDISSGHSLEASVSLSDTYYMDRHEVIGLFRASTWACDSDSRRIGPCQVQGLPKPDVALLEKLFSDVSVGFSVRDLMSEHRRPCQSAAHGMAWRIFSRRLSGAKDLPNLALSLGDASEEVL